MSNLVAIANACAVECERQKVGMRELGYLLEAYEWLAEKAEHLTVTVEVFEVLGSFVEPGKNRAGFRKVPVTFANGGSSANASMIPDLLENVVEAIKDFHKIPPTGPTVEMAHVITKEFLWIHPFVDGNGRCGWLLLNYLLGTLDDPVPLPDFNW